MKRSAPSRRLEIEACRVIPPVTTAPPTENSPEANCVICLDRIQDKSYLNNCLHQFCFDCLVKWSEVKTSCPLCQQKFESAFHNVRSNKDYDVYVFNTADVESSPDRTDQFDPVLIPESHDEIVEDTYVPTYIIMVDFRRYVYANRLLSMPLYAHNRYAACTPQYIRLHQQEVRLRLIPWLNRELGVVISIDYTHLALSIEHVLHVSSEWHMLSTEFRERVEFCTGDKTRLFCWELYNFATSFRTMIEFDDEVRYVVPRHVEVPLDFQQFCASTGTTNPMFSLGERFSLALSPTVQSPFRSVSSIDFSSDTDSENGPDINLYFKTSRCQQSFNGMESDSSWCEGPSRKRPSREGPARPSNCDVPLGRWSSDTSACDSEDTDTARTRPNKKKVRGIKNSGKASRYKLAKTSKPVKMKPKKKSKKGIKNYISDRKETTKSNHMASQDAAVISNPHANDSEKAVEDGHNPSRGGGGSVSVPSNAGCTESACSVRRNTTQLLTEDSSDDGDTDNALSAYRRRCRYEAPLSYYHGGFVPISDATENNTLEDITSSASNFSMPKGKSRLSSVIIKPCPNVR